MFEARVRCLADSEKALDMCIEDCKMVSRTLEEFESCVNACAANHCLGDAEVEVVYDG